MEICKTNLEPMFFIIDKKSFLQILVSIYPLFHHNIVDDNKAYINE